MHNSKTLSWYSQLPRDATESSQLALSDIFYSHAREPPLPPRRTTARNPFVDAPNAENKVRPLSARSSVGELLPGDASYEIESVTNLKDIDPGWVDDEIDEVLLLSRKRHVKKLSVIQESVHSTTQDKIGISCFHLLKLVKDGSRTKCFLATKSGPPRFYTIHVTYQRFLEDSQSCRQTVDEQKILRRITEAKLPFLPRLYWSFLDTEHVYLVTGYYPVTLLSCLQGNDTNLLQNVRFYATELVEAICGLHASGILHRDIGAENILLAEDGHVVLTGLHRAVYVGADDEVGEYRALREGSMVASASFDGNKTIHHAPELILSWSHDDKVDVWSFGIFLHQMLVLEHPFQASLQHHNTSRHRSLNDLLFQAPLQTDSLSLVDEKAADLVTQCLQQNPALRLSSKAMKDHPYFMSVDWTDVHSQKMSVPLLPESLLHNANTDSKEGFLCPDPLPLLEQAHSPETVDDTLDPKNFFFEWQEDSSHLSSGIGNRYTGVAANIPTDMPMDSSSRAPSSSLSVTSFGELRRYQRIPFSRVTDLGSVKESAVDNSNGAVIDYNHSPFQEAWSGVVPSKEATPPARGRLRKYASLNFDLDTIVSLPQDDSDSDSETQSLNKTPVGSKTAPLAHLPRWSPLKNFRFPRSTAAVSPSVASVGRNFLALSDAPPAISRKLVKKSKTPLIPPKHDQHPISGLPTGVEQIGSGIGFTYTRSPSRPPETSDAAKAADIRSSTTPQRSTSLVHSNSRYGSLALLPRILRNKRREDLSEDRDTVLSVTDGAQELEVSMRKTYGSSWALNSTGAAARSAAGLGFGLGTGQSSRFLSGSPDFVSSVREATAGQVLPAAAAVYPDGLLGDPFCSGSTLRLVTPTLTLQERNLWQG